MSNCWLGEQRAFDFVLIKRTYISPSFGHIPHIITMMSSTHKASIGAHIFLNCLWESCSKHASSWFSTAAELSPQCHPCKTDVWEAIKIPQFLRYNPILALLHSIYPVPLQHKKYWIMEYFQWKFPPSQKLNFIASFLRELQLFQLIHVRLKVNTH